MAKDTAGVKLRGCREGMSESKSLDEADSAAGQRIKPADTPNESEELVTVSIELENLESGGIPRVHLGGMQMQMGNANGPGSRADELSSQADGSTVQTDASNRPEMANMSCGNGPGTYLGAGGTKHSVKEMDGIGSHTDASSGCTDVPSIKTDTRIPANAMETVRTPQKQAKPPDSPMETAKWHPDEPNGCGSHANGPSVCTGMQSVGNDAETAAEEAETVRTRQNGLRTQNSPNGCETTTPKHTCQWRKVSVDNVDVYVPVNVPIKTTS